MKTTITKTKFRDAFCDCNRLDNFSYAGLGALFEYLTELEEESGTEFELNVIELCCEYSEYKSAEHWAEEYFTDKEQRNNEVGLSWVPAGGWNGLDLDADLDQYDHEEDLLEYLRYHTTVIEIDPNGSNRGIIVADF